MNQKKIRVLVVDDSILFREVIAKGITSDLQIEVVAKATDPFDARDKILEFHPDVMTCDIEMPKMNGIEFIRRLLPQYNLPIIVVSTVSDLVFEAMSVGAVDFVTKPNLQSVQHVEKFINDMILKIKIAASANITIQKSATEKLNDQDNYKQNKVFAIGSSTGGTEAIYNILKALPKTVPGLLIVQHIPPVFSGMFADRLNRQTGLICKEAQSGDIVEPGKVFIAPGDQHMVVKKLGNKFKIETFYGEKVNGHCPSVDVLFESVAKEIGSDAIGVILTGMGFDGAKGLLAIKNKGGKTIGQNQKSSVVYGMPKVAFNIGAVEKQLALMDIPKAMLSMVKKQE